MCSNLASARVRSPARANLTDEQICGGQNKILDWRFGQLSAARSCVGR